MNELELLRAVLNSATDAICLVGHDRKLKVSNPAYDKILVHVGVLDEEDWEASTCFLTDDVIRKVSTDYEDTKQVADRMIQWLDSQECHWDTVCQSDGRVFQRRCIPIPNHGHLFITQDITSHVQEKARYQTLLQINNALVLKLDKDALFHAVAEEIHRVAAFDQAGITVYDPVADKFFIYVLEATTSKRHLKRGMEIPHVGSAMGWAMDHRTPCVRSDLSAVRDFFEDDLFYREGLQSAVSIPMQFDETVLGTFTVASREPRHFSDTHIKFLTDMAVQMAIAFRNVNCVQDVEHTKVQLHNQTIYLKQEVEEKGHFSAIVGDSQALKPMLSNIETVAPTDSTVLILGETGTGKELVARAIHAESARKAGPMVTVNCGAVPAGLLESEMFGHERGSFTGALSRKIGRFEVAQGGTIFLDEVSELPLELQAKLLRIVEEQTFERLGSTETHRLNVRIIAATNCDLGAAVTAKTFREDLFYRINVFPVHVPSLRERKDDIPLLTRYFVTRFMRKMNKRIDEVDPKAMEQLSQYHWPGNVRELLHVLERAVILCNGPTLVLPDDFTGMPMLEDKGLRPHALLTLEQMEREYIVETLEKTFWAIGGAKGAAKILGLHPNTLRSRMEKLGIRKTTHSS